MRTLHFVIGAVAVIAAFLLSFHFKFTGMGNFALIYLLAAVAFVAWMLEHPLQSTTRMTVLALAAILFAVGVYGYYYSPTVGRSPWWMIFEIPLAVFVITLTVKPARTSKSRAESRLPAAA